MSGGQLKASTATRQQTCGRLLTPVERTQCHSTTPAASQTFGSTDLGGQVLQDDSFTGRRWSDEGMKPGEQGGGFNVESRVLRSKILPEQLAHRLQGIKTDIWSPGAQAHFLCPQGRPWLQRLKYAEKVHLLSQI